MSRCNFCQKEFSNPQAAKAHLRWCPSYQKNKKLAKHAGTSWLSSLTPQAIAGSIVDSNQESLLKQRRKAILDGIISNVVEWYRPSGRTITPEMAVAAKVAILDELGALPIEDLSHSELTLRAEAIRNRVLAPYFEQQQKEGERQAERQRKATVKSQQENHAASRLLQRKKTLIELGMGRALTAASCFGMTGQALVLLEWEVRLRLDTFLTGDEIDRQVDDAIAAAIERPLSEWKTRLKNIQSAQRERVFDKCLAIALPVAEAALPWAKDSMMRKICELLGLQMQAGYSPSGSQNAETETESPHTMTDTPPHRSARRRKGAADPVNAKDSREDISERDESATQRRATN